MATVTPTLTAARVPSEKEPAPPSSITPMSTTTPSPTPSPTPTPVVNPDLVPLLSDQSLEIPASWAWFESPAGFRLAHPPDWIALDLTRADWEALLAEVPDPQLRERLSGQARQLIASQTAALLTAPTPEGEEGRVFASNLNVVAVSVATEASQDEVVSAILQNLRQVPGLNVQSLNRGQVHGWPAVAALYTYAARGQDGRTYPVVGWQVYLRTQPDRLYVLTFSTLPEVFDERIQQFARMVASFEVNREPTPELPG